MRWGYIGLAVYGAGATVAGCVTVRLGMPGDSGCRGEKGGASVPSDPGDSGCIGEKSGVSVWLDIFKDIKKF